MKTIKYSLFAALFSLVMLACTNKENKETSTDANVQIEEVSVLKVGDTIPQILGLNEDSIEVKSADYAGKKLVLYFYPKDYTPGCTAQACSLRDNYDVLLADGYAVLGVSADNVESHKKFREKENLPFSLIADTDKSLMTKFGAVKDGKALRITFVIDENGVIKEIISPEEISVTNHAMQILKSDNK